MLFVFNEGYGHRGVWHIAETAPTLWEHKDAYTREYVQQIRKYDRYGRNPVLLGEAEVVINYPEKNSYRIEEVLCHQVSRLRTQLEDYNSYYQKIKKPGTKYVFTHNWFKRDLTLESETPPPGPVCSRCLSKAGFD